ncbi:MAG: hypothetical protein ACM3UZ_01050 [Acidobacteriota bacterium]
MINYTFLFLSMAAVLLLFSICIYLRKPTLANILVGLVSIAYSLIFDISFGHQWGLFYYISPAMSTFYMVLAAVTVYAPLNIIYTMFLPEKNAPVIVYTGFWIIGMAIFEYASIMSRTIVFTGWRPIPWSGVVYIVAYLWIFFFYRYLEIKIPGRMV